MFSKTISCFMVALATLILFAASVLAIDPQSQDTPVAIVNGSPITQRSFDWQFSVYKRRDYPNINGVVWIVRDGFTQELASRYGPSRYPKDLAVMQATFLDAMIDFELLVQESQKRQITIDNNDIDKILAHIKENYKDSSEFQKELSDINLTEHEFIEELKQNLAVKALLHKTVEKKITVSEEEARKFFEDNRKSFLQLEQVRISHILVQVPQGADEKIRAAARTKIEKIRDRIKKGESFEAVAKEKSDCPSAANGGDLGFFARGDTTSGFLEDAAFTLKPNETTIIWTHLGYDLLKLTGRKDRKKPTFEEVREQVNSNVLKSKFKTAIGDYIVGLRNTAKIEKFY